MRNINCAQQQVCRRCFKRQDRTLIESFKESKSAAQATSGVSECGRLRTVRFGLGRGVKRTCLKPPKRAHHGRI